jgi:nucleoid DNA-binding protein
MRRMAQNRPHIGGTVRKKRSRGTMNKMSKAELTDLVAERTSQPKALTDEIVQAFLDLAADALGKGTRLELRDFGVFECKERAARKGRNPSTGEVMEIPAGASVKFKPSQKLKDVVAHKGVTTSAVVGGTAGAKTK